MHSRKKLLSLLAGALVVFNMVFSGCFPPRPNQASRHPKFTAAELANFRITVTRTNYHGWPDSLLMSNGRAEAIIVPAIGRVMQFRFAGESDGPFWENRALDGKSPDPQSPDWGNFGGDKTWPSPQSDWPRITPRAWPPPVAFDSTPVTAQIYFNSVILVPPVDKDYGIRTRRVIELDPERPILTISTTYEKAAGDPMRVGIWTITQLQNPTTVYMPLPGTSRYPDGYNKQSDALPAKLKVERGLVSLTRDPGNAHKIGSDAGTLLWVGERQMLRIDSARVPDADYPDQASSAEVYTNPDPLQYVELEMLGPLQTLKVGDQMTRNNVYTLLRRTRSNPESEARAILGPRSGARK